MPELRRRTRPRSTRAAFRSLRTMRPVIRPHLRRERGLILLGTLALFGEVLMRLAEPWPLSYVIDGLVAAAGGGGAGGAGAQSGAGDVGLLAAGCAVAYLLITALRALTSYAMTVSFALVGNRVLTAVRADLFDHLQRLSLAFHDKASTGDLVARVTADVGRLKEVSVTALLPLAGNLVTLAGMSVVVLLLDAQLALIILVVLPLFALAGGRMTRRIRTVSRRQRTAEGNLASTAVETLTAMKVVQTYALEDRMGDGFAASNSSSLRTGVQAKRLSAGLERITDALVGAAIAVVLFVGARRVLAGALTPGELTVFLTYLKTAFKPLRDVAKYSGRIAQAGASAERIVEVLTIRPEIEDSSWARELTRVRGHLRFERVWLAYEPGHPVLRGLSFTVPAGERVAVVGPSGAGKSSIVALLSRLRDPDAGSVRIDGHDLRDCTVGSVRAAVSIVLQESVLFRGTIRANIAHGGPAVSDQAIEAAAKLAGAHEFVCALPDGYDTVVGERGATLSGGERQRIAIARAAVRDAPIVVLDEAMTGLDEDTEREVIDALDRLTSGRTTLVITHDLAAARNCDRVLRIEAGAVAADDRRPRAARADAGAAARADAGTGGSR